MLWFGSVLRDSVTCNLYLNVAVCMAWCDVDVMWNGVQMWWSDLM